MPFCRRSGAYGGEWTAERFIFTGSGTPRSVTADVADHAMLDRDTAKGLGSIEAVCAYFNAADVVVPPLVVGARS